MAVVLGDRAWSYILKHPGGQYPEGRRHLWRRIIEKESGPTEPGSSTRPGYFEEKKNFYKKLIAHHAVCGVGKCTQACRAANDIPEAALSQIDLDIPRTFASRLAEYDSPDRRNTLRRILTAFCAHERRRGGFCQGQNFLAAAILLGVNEDEALAFVTLCWVVDICLPPQYYSGSRRMIGLRTELRALSYVAVPRLSSFHRFLHHWADSGEFGCGWARSLLTEEEEENPCPLEQLVQCVCIDWLCCVFSTTLALCDVLVVLDYVVCNPRRAMTFLHTLALRLIETQEHAITSREDSTDFNSAGHWVSATRVLRDVDFSAALRMSHDYALRTSGDNAMCAMHKNEHMGHRSRDDIESATMRDKGRETLMPYGDPEDATHRFFASVASEALGLDVEQSLDWARVRAFRVESTISANVHLRMSVKLDASRGEVAHSTEIKKAFTKLKETNDDMIQKEHAIMFFTRCFGVSTWPDLWPFVFSIINLKHQAGDVAFLEDFACAAEVMTCDSARRLEWLFRAIDRTRMGEVRREEVEAVLDQWWSGVCEGLGETVKKATFQRYMTDSDDQRVQAFLVPMQPDFSVDLEPDFDRATAMDDQIPASYESKLRNFEDKSDRFIAKGLLAAAMGCPLVYEGWAKKKSPTVFKDLKRRYLHLDRGILSWYKRAPDSKPRVALKIFSSYEQLQTIVPFSEKRLRRKKTAELQPPANFLDFKQYPVSLEVLSDHLSLQKIGTERRYLWYFSSKRELACWADVLFRHLEFWSPQTDACAESVKGHQYGMLRVGSFTWEQDAQCHHQ